MSEATKMGMNRTGIATAPKESKATIEFAKNRAPSSHGDIKTEASLLTEYVRETTVAGKVPPPASIKGAVTTAVQKMSGKKPEALIDKIGERLAFERGGVRLYDALLAKCRGEESVAVPGFSMETATQFRNEELEHFHLLADCLKEIGADPTSMTPCANVVAVEASGLMQVMNEPRMTVSQSLNAILTAELADHDGWELLIQLTEKAGMKKAAERFEEAKRQEDRHLTTVREWCKRAAMEEVS